MLKEYIRRICLASLRMKVTFAIDSCVAVAQLSGLLLLARYSWLSASHAFMVIGITCGVVAVGWLITERKGFAPQFIRAATDFSRNWSLGKWILANGIVLVLINQSYPWFLTGFHGAAVTAVFAACWSVVAVVNPLLFGIGNYLGPKTAHIYAQRAGELQKVVIKATIFLTGTVGLLCLAILFFGDQFVALIYGNKYVGNGPVISVLALGFLSSALASSPAYGLLALERPDANFKVNLINLCVTFTFGLWLVKSFGSLGAAYGILVGNTAASVVRWAVFSSLARRQTV